MSDLLFSLPESLSPKRAWMALHGIETMEGDKDEDGDAWWYAWQGEFLGHRTVKGATENDALYALAIKIGVPFCLEVAR